jgi:tryptophan 2,3-dioxygenase
VGNKNAAMLKPHAHRPDLLAMVQAAYEAPSLYDEALRLLARRGLAVPASHTQRDWTQPYAESDGVEQAWLVVYRDPKQHWDLYQLGEELTDLEDAFRLWRFRHVTTVERVIGFKRGTGGTGGVSYLRKMLDVVLFPEIWKLRTDLQHCVHRNAEQRHRPFAGTAGSDGHSCGQGPTADGGHGRRCRRVPQNWQGPGPV